MSAPTFETLSKEVTQALAQESHVPPKTTARCTLGRNKVMVLIEYPLDSAKAEPTAMKTLDWLEQYLRQQFNTVGLPVEAADLAESGEAVPVHLFLKHASESKPFTMRSFVWKVEDSFEALFGSSQEAREGGEAIAASDEPIFHNSSDYDFPERVLPSPEPRPSLFEMEDDEPVLAELEGAHLHLEEESAFDFESELIAEGLPAVPVAADGSGLDFFALLGNERTAAGDSLEKLRQRNDNDTDFDESLLKVVSDPERPDDSSDAAEVASEIADEIADEMSKLTPASPLDPEGDFEVEEIAVQETGEQETLGYGEPIEIEVAEDDADEPAWDEPAVGNEPAVLLRIDELMEAQYPGDEPVDELAIEGEDDALYAENFKADLGREDDLDSTQSYVEAQDYEDEQTYTEEQDSDYYLEGDGTEDDPWEEAVALIDDDEVERQRDQWRRQSRGSRWIFVGALGFVAVGVLGFVLSRPCTVGGCDRIQTAQVAGDEAIDKLSSDTSLIAVNEAKQQLKRSVQLLEPIPRWSSYHAQAQAILPEYENYLQALDQVSEAQTLAYQAAVKSQNPPHPVSTWEDIAKDWLQAANALKLVAEDSPVHELAERKLVEYRANRATTLVRIEAETKAEDSLREAQQAASLGSQQSETASSLAEWEEALASWELAVNRLSQIPQGTNACREAQEVLSDYAKALEKVRDRTQQERSASQNLSKAKQLATEAQRAATEDQWTSATQNWKNALDQLESIEATTSASAEAQLLSGLYSSSLNRAEKSLEVALRFQPIEPSFFATCGTAATQKCTYSVRAGNVRLDLLQGYDSVINQSITPPDQRSNIAPTAQLVSQSNQLLEEITQLSIQAQVPIELYDAKGDFLARYRPELKGFVRN